MESSKLVKPRHSAAEVVAVVLDHIADDEPIPEPTEDDRRWARAQHAKMRTRIAEMRRLHTPPCPMIARAVPIGPDVRALSHGEVLARLERLSQGGAVQYANLDLTGLTDEDLRQLLAVVLANSGE